MKNAFLLLTMLGVSVLFGSNMLLPKRDAINYPKVHPYTQLLNRIETQPKSKPQNYDKLLVILVDFAEETIDDPLTTGNGKFLMEADPNYQTTIGSPPHNRLYFETNLDALRYYYLAVSNESYNLEYDVYPKTKVAYTLPHPMGYYNPVGLGSDVFLQRMEEYFKASFEIADQDDSEIDFSQYGHYMIIHAGSDWQHDVFGDTPSDIPSFFIKVSAGKEAVVDDGYLISHACNVPSTISQDFSSSVEGDDTYYSGYGALNSVIAHEFGHSLGLVDLYNVYNFQPMVGVFDIMDSGGGGVLLDSALDGGYVMVEGALPVLPGAYSRALLFGDDFLQNGMMKEMSRINLADNVIVAASSKKQAENSIKPTIVKVPLNNDEYLLIENRSVDPDGDGATAVHGELDNRVIMYPTPTDPNQNDRTYEYDYLLPSFVASSGASIGGGILVWHVNNEVIYHQGIVDAEGNFYSNFENNSVNTRISSRGVRVIEADGLPDIGNSSSYYWTGTAYEYFHKHQAILDVNGHFVNWSQEIWRDKLNSISTPALIDDQGNPSFYGITINSDPLPLMSINFTTALFDHSQVIDTQSTGAIAAPVINSSFTNNPELPVITGDSVSLYTHNIQQNLPDFTTLFGSQAVSLPERIFPSITSETTPNNTKELVWTSTRQVNILEYANDDLSIRNIMIENDIQTAPLFLDSSLWIASVDNLTRVTDSNIETYPLAGIKCLASVDNTLITLSTTQLTLYSPLMLDTIHQYTLPEALGSYEPVIFQDTASSLDYMIFIMSNTGNVYKLQDSVLTKIFTNTSPYLPSQMGLTNIGTDNAKTLSTPTLFFGIENQAFAIRHDGSFVAGFPKQLTNVQISPLRNPRSLMIQDESILLYPYGSGSFIAINSQGKLAPQYDFNNPVSDEGFFWWDEGTANLYWIYAGQNGQIMINGCSGLTANPIVWNGFRNGNNGVLAALYSSPSVTDIVFNAYVFPNPVRGKTCRVHIENAIDPIKIMIFDIAGQVVFQQNYASNDIVIRDLEIDTSKLSSGVYILSTQCGSKVKKLKFAVEK